MLSINAIEVTNFCNLRCNHCPNHITTYPKGCVTVDYFTKALNYAQDAISISLHGEPLMHPKICELIKIAKQFRNIVGLSTNGLLLTESMCNKLIEAKLGGLEISIHTEKSLLGYKTLFDINEAAGNVLAITGNILTCYEPQLKDWIKNIQLEEKHLSKLRLAPMHNWALDPSSQNNYKDRCAFIRTNACVMKWDGKIYSCCFDFDGINYIGEIDNFPNLQHNPDSYKLCSKCSPAWTTGQSLPWYDVPESYLQ